MSTTTKWPRKIRNAVAAVRDSLAELERRGRGVAPEDLVLVLGDARAALDELRECAGARVRAGDASAVSMGLAVTGAMAALRKLEDALLKAAARDRDRRGRQHGRRRRR